MAALNPRILSSPMEVNFLGFRSDTFRLQAEGWRIAAEEDIPRRSVRLLMSHSNVKLYALTAQTMYDYDTLQGRFAPVFTVNHIVNDIQVLKIHDNFASFRQIDARPMYIDQEIRAIEDLHIFRDAVVQTEEIIVEPADVASLLDQIKRMQSPEQAEIRARNRGREARGDGYPYEKPQQAQQIHAQIVTLQDFRQAA